MSGRRSPRITAQAWVELVSHDPEAVSALAVARVHLAAGARLSALRRARVFELTGTLPGRAALEELLHRSTQFYNPHKERCTLRLGAAESAPVGEDEQAVIVTERGGERRGAAERWWRHETGHAVEVREGVAWMLRFEAGVDRAALARDLAELRTRAHGLLCNPHSQEWRASSSSVPLPWLTAARPARRARAREAR
jgi:hypothetical protein